MSTPSDHQHLPQQGHDLQAPGPKRQVKKQTRRRVHTSRPYQESLLNMAEARREIVTALRIHRSNMRQQSKYQQEQSKQRQRQARVLQQEQSQQAFEPPPVATSCAFSTSATTADTGNHRLCSSQLAHLVPAAGNHHSSSMLSYDLAPLQVEEEAPPPAAVTGDLEQFVCNLPAQPLPLGLNLSFQGFGDDPFGAPWIQPLSPCPAAASYSAYSSPVTTTTAGRHGYTCYYSLADAPAELMSRVLDGEVMPYTVGGGGGGGERQLGAELMSEAAANVAAASAWWTKILESVAESGGEGAAGAEEVCKADDDVAEAWQWLCDGAEQEVAAAPGPEPDVLESNTTHVGDDIALPQCVGTEGWDDGEWFS